MVYNDFDFIIEQYVRLEWKSLNELNIFSNIISISKGLLLIS